MKKLLLLSCCLLGACTQAPVSEKIETPIYATTGEKQQIGTVTFYDTSDGLKGVVNLEKLPIGEHGFHLHAIPDCGSLDGEPAMKAGGHYDPEQTGKHLGPDGDGHKGDLPRLMTDDEGHVRTAFYIPHLTLQEIKGRSVVIHEFGDNYSDSPRPLGGGGKRIACGIIK